MRALVTGATGFIGRRLVSRLERPVVLGRGPIEPAVLDGIDTVFNLAGEPVAAGRWTDEKKRRILESRELGTRRLVEEIAARSARPKVLVSASAVGYYGSRGDEPLDESAAAGDDFLARVCVAWEREAAKAADLGLRVVRLRIGVVLGSGGGALAQMLPPFRLGLGGPLGDGRQWMPWIHLDDVVSLMLFAAERQDVSGALNAVAPSPVTNADFTRELAAALHRPAFLRVPYVVLRLAMGELAEVLFASQRALPKAALAHGFRFEHPEIAGAIRAAVSSASG